MNPPDATVWTPAFIAALVTGICTILAAVGAMIISLRSSKVVAEKVDKVEAKVETVHVLVNDKMTKALTETAEGKEMIARLNQLIVDISKGGNAPSFTDMATAVIAANALAGDARRKADESKAKDEKAAQAKKVADAKENA